jgi:hypothetical protein
MKKEPRDFARWWMVVLYAVAMAWVESAVVFYLRSMLNRLEPHQTDPLPLESGFASVELPREMATMIMLFVVGFLAGRTWRARIGYSAIAFGVWDIFYYVFLKIICGWPHSLLDWDVLFLLPLPWWGPVLAPMLISLLLILWGTFSSQFERIHPPMLSNWRVWVFMADCLAVAGRGPAAIRAVLPEKFNWPLFCPALLLMSAPVLQSGGRMLLRRRAKPEASGSNQNFDAPTN